VSASPALSGLTAAEVAERVRRGQVNRTPRSEWREYAAIFRRNLFTGFNAMVAPAAVALLIVQEYRAAIAVSGMAILNTLLALIQEIRAKVHLDRLSLLVESRTQVVRDGHLQTVRAGEIVKDDCIFLQAGDTVVADGHVVAEQFLEIDEALLTGESDPVRRHTGDRLLSGSICVAGEGHYRAEEVGPASFANRTSAEARRLHLMSSPATRVINRIVRWLSYTAIALCVVHLIGWWRLGLTDDDVVKRIASTITTMVPQGLVLSATLSFIVGAVAMSRRGAVVQRLNAVETMAAIDVVCTDKTGTLTTNHLVLELVRPIGTSEEVARDALRLFASASIDRNNRNIEAIQRSLGFAAAELIDQVPFKSRNRYSALRVRTAQGPRLFVIGAIEALEPRLEIRIGDALADREMLQSRGLRLLLLTEGPGDQALDGTQLPDVRLRPVALIGLADELRPDTEKVLEALSAQGIEFKVVSGDNPETVQGTVRHLPIPLASCPCVTGDAWSRSTDRDRLVRESGVFGRIAPEQKVEIVEALARQGRHVAMIGDGVNDVLPIKRAELGIAMGSGSPASKTVAGLVLENDRFDLLPETLEEGRTILRNLRRSGKLFLVKNVYAFILILATYCGCGIPYPFVPQQVTLLNWSVIGIPALAIAASRERPLRAITGSLFWDFASFALRTGVVFGVGGVFLLWHMTHVYPGDPNVQRTIFLSMLILLGITTLFRALRDGDPNGRDDRFRLLGLLAIPVYLTAMYVPPSAYFFEMTPLGLGHWGWALAYAGGCWAATLVADRVFPRPV
jgi:cation-transporting ATPase E